MKHIQDMFKGGIAAGQLAMFVVTPQTPKSGVATVNVLKERPAGGPLSLSADFTHLEDRIIAYAGKGMGIDCHRQKAAEMFNVAYEDVTPDQRAAGKDANYLSWWNK